MNILYYLREFPKLSETFILNEIYALKQRGHNVAVFAIGDGDKSVTHEEFDNLNVPLRYADVPNPVGAAKSFFSTLTAHSCFEILSMDVPVKTNVGNVIWAGQCIEFLDGLEWEIDCIHSHFATPFPLPCPYLSTHYDVPFTLTTHAHDIFKEPIGDYTEKLLSSADRVVTISEYNREYMRERFTFETAIDVVHAGVRLNKFDTTAPAKDGRVLTVARLHPKKGIMTAIEAIAIVAQEIPNVEYHIVGSGSQYDELVSLVSSLGIEENVMFLNNVSDAELVAEFERARCFLLPSVITESGERDGIPVSLMEAMSMRTPVVSTTTSGIPELVDHGENGLLTAPRDPNATAELVLRLLQNDAEWRKLSRRAREKILDEFSVQTQVDGLLTTFEAARSKSSTDEQTRSTGKSAHLE
ncbi:glycosyltransferase [Halorubrum sp. Eb13]|uniref:glycosyltransferase n=1 Tax=Halorubrum sp. Eb13 TaxID=1383843 RepID=UPI000B99071C|nr:glycosyltransferase [Halorubrum sp. Eb13]OYR41435.1 hypothetical protein DJ75_14115 [Halorubrum sp. Eb13]